MSHKGILVTEEQETSLELQHINIKLLLGGPENLDLDAVVNVFHGWIQDQVADELLLDVADYRHVHQGPGIVLIGHGADYAIDNTDGRLGIRYNRKAPVEGSNLQRLAQATRSALTAAQRLQEDALLSGKCNFNGQDLEILINDRVLAPNSAETRSTLEGDLCTFLDSLFGDAAYTLSFETDSRRLFRATVKAAQPLTAAQLLKHLDVYNGSHHAIR